MSKNKKTDYSKYLMIVALICLMAGGYIVSRKKIQLREAANLPFYKIELSEIEAVDVRILELIRKSQEIGIGIPHCLLIEIYNYLIDLDCSNILIKNKKTQKILAKASKHISST